MFLLLGEQLGKDPAIVCEVRASTTHQKGTQTIGKVVQSIPCVGQGETEPWASMQESTL